VATSPSSPASTGQGSLVAIGDGLEGPSGLTATGQSERVPNRQLVT
jgi:hypothetical protein